MFRAGKREVKDITASVKTTVEKIVREIPIDEIREALVNEYRRRLIRYKMIDESMRKKIWNELQQI
ncbi:hypothetical protein M1N62_01445 [Thermodesulfovibrionales bacterium]|nr:hypothetical protein [Thermodesulfovibrionales bacterium]